MIKYRNFKYKSIKQASVVDFKHALWVFSDDEESVNEAVNCILQMFVIENQQVEVLGDNNG